jgi:hypothetical protein
MRQSMLTSLQGLAFISNILAAPTTTNTSTTILDWSQIEPSVDVQWQPCFENFTCTRLEVPLDYEDARAGNTAIAFIKYTPNNATKDTKDILFNPGRYWISVERRF